MTNKVFFLCTLFIINWSYSMAQDSIFRANGEVIEVSNLEIGTEIVKYKKFNNPDGPVYSIPVKLLNFIVLRNREVITFEQNAAESSTQPEGISPSTNQEVIYFNKPKITGVGEKSLFQQGYFDASLYYQSYRGAGTASLLSTLFLSPLYGLVTPVFLSVFGPTVKPNVVNYDKMNQPLYYNGYKSNASKIRLAAIWRNYGIGSAVWLGLILLILAAAG